MSSEIRPVVVVGSINMDLVVRSKKIPAPGETVLGNDFQVHPGGKGANQAVAVGRLGYPVALIGRVGDDGFGGQLREHLERSGVDLDGVMTSKGSSGVAVIVVSETGENCIVVTPGANALLTPQDLDEKIEILRSASLVLTQLEIPIETVHHLAKLCLREGVPLILDPAPAQELPPGLIEMATWFTPNETEAAFYVGRSEETGGVDSAETVRLLRHAGARGVVLKLGSRGAYLAPAGEESRLLASFPVKSVDTTAAGDAFNGAFATGLSMKMSVDESARFASAAAAISVTRAGAQPSMADLPEVIRMLGDATLTPGQNS